MPTTSPAPATVPPSGPRLWWAGARPRTLPVSVVPVAVGAALAARYVAAPWYGHLSWWRIALALVVSLMLQVGVNYANDYSDGVRGTDADRVGPLRLTGSGLVAPAQVKAAAFGCFGVAALAGLALAATTSWWLVAVGAAAILAAWFYTGGATPYGYLGLGDVAVFVFFGPVAVIGSAYVAGRPPQVTWQSALASVPIGLLAVAVLVANNLRDLPKDAAVGKRTSAVRMGDRATRVGYAVIVIGAFLLAMPVVGWPWLLLALAATAFAVPPVRAVLRGAAGRDLIPVLARTGRLQVVCGMVIVIGLLAAEVL
ncbi:1,4-dihydroxy-2-naphthoate polyprenyltransferase [Cumulibacter manganitolerans]|uniref:1,4-dihydroxy-2-naphthoate polyprenyltransferase n=1 Tax=Cumulibacter manganitolerans TaxID=1884992 RepID=UPI001E2F39C7|nr:1,4-dihydroxy-2-naphthoate polyprenyltransferase [Cumulibacter manganitolerans]